MGPHETDRELEAVRQAHPGWDFHEVLGGYVTVPVGTPLINGMFVSSVVEKLQAHEAAHHDTTRSGSCS